MSENKYQKGTLGWVMEKLEYTNIYYIDGSNDVMIDAFDFTEDWNKGKVDSKKYNDYINLNLIDKYFTYKMVSKSSLPNYSKAYQYWKDTCGSFAEYLIDPDTYSELLQSIYKVLWDMSVLKICQDNKDRIHGDTMNSITTTMSKFFRCLYEVEYYGSTEKKGFAPHYCGSLWQSLEIYLTEKNNGEDYENEKWNKLKNFIRVNHTLGNFIPVPFESDGGSFNRPRYTSTKDYWDLTLKYIYDWYGKNSSKEAEEIINELDKKCDCENNNSLCKLLGGQCKDVKLCVKWLCKFVDKDNKPSWNVFVKKNYLQPFVVVNMGSGDTKNEDRCDISDLEEAMSFGEPLELWKGHFNQSNPMPGGIDSCNEFFLNATNRIELRRELMKNALIEKLENSPLSES